MQFFASSFLRVQPAVRAWIKDCTAKLTRRRQGAKNCRALLGGLAPWRETGLLGRKMSLIGPHKEQVGKWDRGVPPPACAFPAAQGRFPLASAPICVISIRLGFGRGTLEEVPRVFGVKASERRRTRSEQAAHDPTDQPPTAVGRRSSFHTLISRDVPLRWREEAIASEAATPFSSVAFALGVPTDGRHAHDHNIHPGPAR